MRNVGEDFDNLEDAPPVNNWDDVSYINRPVEIHEECKATLSFSLFLVFLFFWKSLFYEYCVIE